MKIKPEAETVVTEQEVEAVAETKPVTEAEATNPETDQRMAFQDFQAVEVCLIYRWTN